MKEKNLLPTSPPICTPPRAHEDGRTPSERELAEHFDVSRGQIREALADPRGDAHRRAAGEVGHLSDHARRPSVEAMALFAKAGVPLDPIQIYETVELRKIHEIKAAELACSRATEENFERLREILDRLGRAHRRRRGPGRGGPRFPPRDRARHAEQRLPQDLLASITSWASARLPIYFSDPERNRRSHAEHLQIFEALVRRDGNLAQALMSAHLQGVESYWKGLIGDRCWRDRRRDARKGLSLGRDLFDPSAAPRGHRDAGKRRANCASPPPPTPQTLDREAADADIIIVRAPCPPGIFAARAAACAPRSAMAPAST